jgi:hypothetical protein
LKKKNIAIILFYIFVQLTLWMDLQKISLDFQYVPTIMNGMTSLTSILVGFTGLLLTLGITNHIIHFKESKDFIYILILSFFISLNTIVGAYSTILNEASTFPLRISFSGLITAFFAFMSLIFLILDQL